MRKISFAISLALITTSFASTAAYADKIKATKDQVRSACNKAGGELLGISEFGSYGCDNGANGGGMILCNKNSECQTYRISQSPADTRRWQSLVGNKKLSTKAAG